MERSIVGFDGVGIVHRVTGEAAGNLNYTPKLGPTFACAMTGNRISFRPLPSLIHLSALQAQQRISVARPLFGSAMTLFVPEILWPSGSDTSVSRWVRFWVC